MDPMKAIVAGTRLGAEAMGMERDIGTLEKGKFADIVAMAGDPLAISLNFSGSPSSCLVAT